MIKNNFFKKSLLLFCAIFGCFIGELSFVNSKQTNIVNAETPDEEKRELLTFSDTSGIHDKSIASTVSPKSPIMTILTHGLGGSSSDWSNDYADTGVTSNFVEDSDSLISKINLEAENDTTMLSIFVDKGIEIYDDYSDKEPALIVEENYISNIKFEKHTIVVMDLQTNRRAMKDVYSDFHKVIDLLVYIYSYNHEDEIPTINLIGQSMGGLINMQYAIEHPKNVASLISLGTPYNGSWYDNGLTEMFMDDFNENPCLNFTCGHSYYFCNNESRKSKWNKVYSQNKHIKFYALAGTMSTELWQHIVKSVKLKNSIKMSKIICGLLKELIFYTQKCLMFYQEIFALI